VPYCPGCRGKYEGQPQRCPLCGERLPAITAGLRGDSPLVRIYVGPRPMVEMLADILKQQGVPGLVKRSQPLYPELESPAFYMQAELWIRQDDLEENREVVEQEVDRFMGEGGEWEPAEEWPEEPPGEAPPTPG